MFSAQCHNENCDHFEETMQKRGRNSFGSIYLDEPYCKGCNELLVVIGGAVVLS